LSDQVGALASGRPADAGQLGGYLEDARGQIGQLASRIEQGGLDGLLNDVSRFARRRPGVFLAAAAGAGFLIGRLVRAGVSVSGNGSESDTQQEPAALAPPTIIADAPGVAVS
jgi:hypothetical protein